MWKTLLLASLLTAVGVAALTAAAPAPQPGLPGPDFPGHTTRAGVLRYSTVETPGGAVRAWWLEEGQGNPVLRFQTPELREKADRLLDREVQVKVTTHQLADALGGHVVLQIDPAGGAGPARRAQNPN